MKLLRRVVFLVVVGLLVAAIPLSVYASDGLLRSSVQSAESHFSQSLAHARATGLDTSTTDSLLSRYSQVTSLAPGTWWQAPAAHHQQLERIATLQAELDAAYLQATSDQRDGFLRAVHGWDGLLAQAQLAGVSADGLDASRSRFVADGARARTPDEFKALGQVVGSQMELLASRLAGFRAAQSAAQVTLQNLQALLTRAALYPQLHLDSFQGQLQAAVTDMAAAHTEAAWRSIQGRLQQTAVSVQQLLNARSSAYAQLADTQNTLATARSIGANFGQSPALISALAVRVAAAGDQATLQSLTSQLYQQKQALTDAIWTKQANFTPGPGKVILISLARQTLTAYQDGQVVLTTYVATGRPQLPTPPGVYQIIAKYTPFKFISPWPLGSPYWYPSSWTSYAMLFRGGGYFIHDAPWRSWYGPGSNLYNGTHGCVNVPLSPMRFLFSWAPIGTTVVVQ